jgi:Putative Ig domain/IPT/TIG domain
MSFPTNPQDQQTAQVNGIIYVWNAAKGAWRRKVDTGVASDQGFNGNIIANSGAVSISTTTGAIQVTRGGGVGVTGNVNAGAFYSNNYFYANGQPIIVQTASTANSSGNIAGGLPGQLLYQTSANVTGFVTNGDIGKILASNGPGNMPIWVDLQQLATLSGAPYITQLIYPNGATTASDGGGDTIYVQGSGFKPGFNITINSAPVLSATYITSSNVSFVTSPETIGSYELTLTNPNRQSTTYDFIEFSGAGVPRFLNPPGYLNFVQQNLGFNQYIGVAGGYTPYNFQITRGALPTGLTIDSGSGLISGNAPSVDNPTSFNFTVQVTDAHSQVITRDFYILVTVPLVLSNQMTMSSRGSDYLRSTIATANVTAGVPTLTISSAGSDYLRDSIAVANVTAALTTMTLSSRGSDYLRDAVAVANVWANVYTVTMSSVGYHR